MLKVILLAVCLLGLGVLGMAVKIWAKKDGTFNGTCASKFPLFKAPKVKRVRTAAHLLMTSARTLI